MAPRTAAPPALKGFPKMKSSDIREKFLAFFESKDHLRHPSSSLVPDDPTLLTTSAGMVQFKPYFLAQKKPPRTRLTTSQKCLRAIDLEEVGRTPRHHTFFEMLGNFSFGDYFKEDAITWAWEFLTEHLEIPAERLKITIYLDDEEAAEIWQKKIGIPDERFFRLGEDDNFWPAGAPSKGPNGPCGPCSEIFYDFGPERGCGKPDCGPDCDCNRHIEIWNLVFMQYERKDGGELVPLPNKNIDTGSGLERLCSVLQGTLTNFETDLFMPVISMLEELTGKKYDDTPVPFRVVADHIRGAAFLIGDGVFPSNEGRGYLLRKILRRAAINGRDLGMTEPFLSQALEPVVATLESVYPEIREKQPFIKNIIVKEEEQFAEAMIQGKIFLVNHLKESPDRKPASGEICFTAYDTYGLPLEEAEKIVRELGYSGVDKDAFQQAMSQQKERSRKGSKMDGEVFAEDAEQVYREAMGESRAGVFEGYDSLGMDTKIVSLVVNGAAVDSAQEGQTVDIITEATPFYGEMGGQIGDKGGISGKDAAGDITDTFVVEGHVMVHRVDVKQGAFKTGDSVKLTVDESRRMDIMRHHTATHLLHAALRKVLGDHVVQSGSYVGPDKLRFDFTHHEAVAPDTLQRIEDLVNEQVMACTPVDSAVTDFQTAKKSGAMALFGEKYGSEVRVVSVGGFSKELCGGTHMQNTGGIGLVKITDERAIGASLRRIEAVAGARALEYINEKLATLRNAAGVLKVPDVKLPDTVQNMARERDSLSKELKKLLEEKAREEATGSLQDAETVNGASVFVLRLQDADRNGMLSVYDDIKVKTESYALLLGSEHGGKVMFLAAFSDDLVKRGLDAGALVKQVAGVAGGGGGGKKHMAQAGAKDASKIPEALELGKKLIIEKLSE